MPKYVFWCVYDHLDFRIPEFEAIAELFEIDLDWIDKNQTHPWVIINLKNDSEAKQICSRSISTKICVKLWTQSDQGWKPFHENLRKFSEKESVNFGPEISFKMQIESFMKKLKSSDKMASIESFDYLPIEGPVKLDKPDVIFVNLQFHGFDQNNLPEEPLHLFFGEFISDGQRDLITR